MWEGFPVHYASKHGWGYIVPAPEKLENDRAFIEEREQEGEEEEEEEEGGKMSKYPVR